MRRIAVFINNQSIFNKIFYGIVGIVLLVISISIVTSYIYLHRSHENEAMKNAARLVDNINTDFQENLDQVDRIIMSIYADNRSTDASYSMQDVISTRNYTSLDDEYKSLKVTRDFFQRLIFLRKDFSSIYIYVSREKTFSFGVNGRNKLDYDPSGEAWFRNTVTANGKTVISAPHLPYQLDYGKEVLSFSRLLKSLTQGTKEPDVVVLIDFTIDSLNSIVGKVNLGKTIGTLFLDSAGKVVYSNNTGYTEKDLARATIDKVMGSHDGNFTALISGKKYLVAFNTSGITGWKLMTLTPYSEVEKDDRNLALFYLLLILAALVITVFISFVFSRAIFKPIKRLQSGMRKVQEGNFDVRLEEPSGDELGQLVGSFNAMTFTIKTLIVEKYEEKLARNNAEFKYLQAQINPHFIYNTLQTISSMAVVRKVPEINSVSKRLAKILRYSLNTRSKIISIGEELENLVSYLEIQKLRFKEFLNYEIAVDEEAYEFGIIKLVLQPIVENAISHGIEPKGENGMIRIAVKLQAAKDLEISVTDNGAGMTAEELEQLMRDINLPEEGSKPEVSQSGKGSGNNIGLKNIHFRIKLVYGQEYGLFIESTKGEGTTVKVRIPAHKLEQEAKKDERTDR